MDEQPFTQFPQPHVSGMSAPEGREVRYKPYAEKLPQRQEERTNG